MADNTTEAAAGYVDAVKWIVGLSGAVLAGIFLHPEQLDGRPQGVRVALIVVVAFFVISIGGGVGYLLWINRVRRVKERITEIDEETATPVVVPDLVRQGALNEERKELVVERDGASTEMSSWFQLLLIPFFIASVGGGAVFCLSIFWPKKVIPPVPPVAIVPLHFTMTQSAVHHTAHGMQAHTFLLDQQSGEMWQMVCDQKGAVVGFQRIRRLDVKGNPEPDVAKKP